jgi:hypothetical protein
MRRAFVGATFAAMVSMSCSAILGIDFPPLLASGDDGGDAEAGAGLDAPADVEATICPLSEPLPCRAGCAHAFCEDFEDAGALFPRWVPPSGVVNPFVLGDGSVVANEPGASSSPRGLSVMLAADTKATAALLFHRLPAEVIGDPSRVDGIRVVFDARVESSDLAEAGGPTPDAGTALLAFLGSGTDKVSGPSIGVGERDIILAASTDLLRGGNTELSVKVTEGVGTSTVVPGVWVRLSLFAGSASRAQALGYAACPDVPYVFAAGWSVAMTCVAATPAFTLAALPVDVTLVVGTSLRGRGSVSLRYDNVFVDVYRAP